MIYGNADGFKEYMGSRGKKFNCSWTDDVIESALLVASEWLDGIYESQWVGYKTGGYEQERSWPRKSATIVLGFGWYTFPENEIPKEVIKATYEVALRHLKDENILMPDFKQNQYKSVSIHGAISVMYNDTITTAADVQTQFPIVQNLMSDLIVDNESSNPLVGKAVRT